MGIWTSAFFVARLEYVQRGGGGDEYRSNLMTVAFVVAGGATSPTCRRFGECLIKEILYGKFVALERDLLLFRRILG